MATGTIQKLMPSDIGVVRPNLLDNWYFVGGGSQSGWGKMPINQRGQTTYTPNASNTYTIDRWRTGIATGTVTLYAGSMMGSNNFLIVQPIDGSLDMYGGKTVTLSILTSQGLWTGTGTLPSSAPASATQIATAYITSGGTNIGYGDVQINTLGNVSVRLRVFEGSVVYFWAVKLELGSTQTLAHKENGTWVLNEVPNYNNELAKCQAYFMRFAGLTVRYAPTQIATNIIDFTVPLPVTMRGTPTSSATLTASADMSVYINGAAQTGFTFSVANVDTNALCIRASKNAHGATGGDVVYLNIGNGVSSPTFLSLEP